MIPPTPAVDASGIAICHTPSCHLPQGPRSRTIHLKDGDTPDFAAGMKELYLTANDSISFSSAMDVINNVHYDSFHVPNTVINDDGNSVFSPSDAAPLFHNIGVAINSLIQESAVAKNRERFLIAQVHNCQGHSHPKLYCTKGDDLETLRSRYKSQPQQLGVVTSPVGVPAAQRTITS